MADELKQPPPTKTDWEETDKTNKHSKNRGGHRETVNTENIRKTIDCDMRDSLVKNVRIIFSGKRWCGNGIF